MAYAGESCNSYMKLVGDYYVHVVKERCFCGGVGCMKSVVTIVPNLRCGVPEFLMREEIHIWPMILTPSD